MRNYRSTFYFYFPSPPLKSQEEIRNFNLSICFSYSKVSQSTSFDCTTRGPECHCLPLVLIPPLEVQASIAHWNFSIHFSHSIIVQFASLNYTSRSFRALLALESQSRVSMFRHGSRIGSLWIHFTSPKLLEFRVELKHCGSISRFRLATLLSKFLSLLSDQRH